MSEKYFIEQRREGDFAIRKGNSERASAVEPTQEAAIKRAKEMDSNATIQVERVRNTETGGRDQWRKP